MGAPFRRIEQFGQLSSVLLDWVSLANGFVYDSAGRLSEVSYPLAGARLAPVVHDSNGNVTGLDFRTSAGVSFASSTVTRAASGRVLTASGNGSLLWSYGYDAAGRLVSAAGSGRSYAYDFAPAVSPSWSTRFWCATHAIPGAANARSVMLIDRQEPVPMVPV